MSGHPSQGAVPIHGPEFLIPIFFFLVVGGVGFSFTPIGRAIARRLGGTGHEGDAREMRALQAEVDELHAEVDAMRGRLGEVDELHSRLDFAERMLASARERSALPPAAPQS